MKRILQLQPSVANQIAAGEVVERPASVVKELVENAIDAGASAITVEIQNSGTDYIRVTDNGSGIAPEDCLIAFERHATSKIEDARDLMHIETLGFRGEALASIAAVARVTLKTRVADADTGTLICMEGGVCIKNQPVACPDGTTMEVENLFYNTPARLKFLKTARTETGYIGEYVAQMIMARPDISFRLINNGREVYYSDGADDLRDAICCVYGTDILPQLVEIEHDDGYLKLWGVIGNPQIARPNRMQQSFFVNGRFIRSALLSAALQRAYETRLMSGRFPFAVVAIRIASGEVDVNVHPNKTQVRFVDEARLANTLTDVCKKALYRVSSPELVWPKRKETSPAEPQTVQNRSAKELRSILQSSIGQSPAAQRMTVERVPIPVQPVQTKHKEPPRPAEEKHLPVPPALTQQEPSTIKEPERKPNPDQYRILTETIKRSTHLSEALPGTTPELVAYRIGQRKEEIRIQQEKQESFLRKNSYQVIGQIFATYWIVQQDQEIFFIDQHAAHERKLYEEFTRRQQNHETVSQLCLVPIPVQLDAVQYTLLEENAYLMEKLGFGLELNALDYSVQITAVPYIVGETKAEAYLYDALDILNRKGKVESTELVREELTQASCKHAVKAGTRLDPREIEALLDAYVQDNIPLTCPHGRPVMIHMGRKDLEKLFKRLV